MSDEQQELLTGREGNEAAQGWTQMAPANPVSSPDDLPADAIFTEEQLAHAKRPATDDWGPEPVERDYVNNQTGEATPSNQVVGERQAAADLAAVRAAEADARKLEGDRDLAEALDTLHGRDQGQQSAQDQQPAAVDEPQPDAPQMTAEEAQRLYTEADRELETALQNPLLREKLETEFNGVRQTAAAEVQRAHALAATAQNHYAEATTNLVNEASAVLAAVFLEVAGLSGEALRGAVAAMQRSNPQRAEQLIGLANRASGLVQAQARQQYEQQQGQALQRDAALEQYTSANVKEYEQWTAKDNPETMRSIRENLKPIVEKQYGVPFETLMAIHTGKMQMGATEFVRSAAFQKMLHNSIKYELASRAVTEARSNPIPRVQRPGTSVPGPRVHEGDLAAAASRFNLPGGNEGPQGLRNATAWITAKRGARG